MPYFITLQFFLLPHLFAFVSLAIVVGVFRFLDEFKHIEAIISPMSAIYHLLPPRKKIHNWKFQNSLISKCAYTFCQSDNQNC